MILNQSRDGTILIISKLECLDQYYPVSSGFVGRMKRPKNSSITVYDQMCKYIELAISLLL
jgi:hypothetical protein